MLPDGFTAGVASAAERDEVLGQTHPFWGGERTLDAYRARTRELMATPWGREHYRFWVLRDGAGGVAASCKVYDLPLWVEGRVWPAFGIGAVFTPEGLRRRGYAAAMLQALLAERTRGGDRFATLFSDIAPVYYERLGFARLSVGKFRTSPERLPPAPEGCVWRDATDADSERVVALAQATIRRFDLAYERGPLDLAHLSLAYRAPFRMLERGGETLGFVFVTGGGATLEIQEWGLVDPGDSARLLGALRSLLPPGCERVLGWLPPADPVVLATFERAPDEDAIWMIAALAAAAPRAAGIPAHRQLAWTDDHF